MVKIDIEMPTYCCDCPCHNGENGRCNITGNTTFDKRPFDCPLKETNEQPDADVVVRCRNCQFSEEIGPDLYICHNEGILIIGSYVDANWHCGGWKSGEKTDGRLNQ